QESDGHWIAPKWDKAIPDDQQKDVAGTHDVGITGFALLALMGGGHTIRKGDYRRNVLRGIQWLVKQQKPNGALTGNMYEHAIATIALCEAFGRAPDEEIGKAARKSINFCAYAVADDGGWRYAPKSKISDMSVTGWFIQALKTAKLANIKFDHKLFSNAMTWVDRATDEGGTRSSTGGISYTVTKAMKYGDGSLDLGGAGMVIRQFSGTGIKSHLLIKAAKIQQKTPPTWESKNFYRWYYTTYAMHNMGGEYRIWWNRRIRDILLENQSKSGDQAGSWEPSGDAHGAGRVYSTALGALCLEVYYRYGDALRGFGTAPDLDDLFFE
ncbi:MAG: hypothetical protein HRT89_18030, partial [Lentisphaeria bacterium]|nr:hypothetical protein [Lentisphaeria bacterium]NQZ69956.1 hypothetical protein [Lentisphaeria bacterium]